jgi:hypothetical protein
MITSGVFASLLYDSKQLKLVDVNRLPVSVCGVLGRQLQTVSTVGSLRADIAKRLRRTLQPEWILTADIAVVALALDGLQACAPQLITGNDLGSFAMRLMNLEVAVGGPYRRASRQSSRVGTQDDNRADVADATIDPFTNACIAQCLEWMAGPLPNVLNHIVACTPGVKKIDIADWALFIAVCASDEMRRGASAITDIVRSIDLVEAALCAQIIHCSVLHSSQQSSDVAEGIHRYCFEELPSFSEPFQTNTRSMLEQVMSVDTNHEISQLAWYYGNALESAGTKSSIVALPTVSPHTYAQLGTANIYAWAAYTIYDDFLDNEGQPTMLGTANYAFRAMIRYYQGAVPNNPAFQLFVERILTTVDQANSLETTYYRLPVTSRALTLETLPDFGVRDLLADRALFHALGPMAVLVSSNRAAIGDAAWEHTLQALRHYLISRQLNDDIHDWQKDLRAGQATYVVVELLRHLNLKPGSYAFDWLLPQARERFWQEVLSQICDTALEHVALARSHLKQGPPLTARGAFLGLFDYVEGSLREAQYKRQQSQALLQTLRR